MFLMSDVPLQDHAWGPTVVLGGGLFAYERETPVSTFCTRISHDAYDKPPATDIKPHVCICYQPSAPGIRDSAVIIPLLPASRVRVSSHAAQKTMFGTLRQAPAIKPLQEQLRAIDPLHQASGVRVSDGVATTRAAVSDPTERR